jgi:hypothetical protein
VVGVRGTEPPVVVELKRSFSLALVLQAVDRLSLTDRVYLAIGERPRRIREVRRLCRLLGCGLLLVGRGVEVVLDPLPYAPRRATGRTTLLLGEHARQEGNPDPRSDQLEHEVRIVAAGRDLGRDPSLVVRRNEVAVQDRVLVGKDGRHPGQAAEGDGAAGGGRMIAR